MKKIVCIFLLLSSIGFSDEIFQGTLKNGMKYYFLPESQFEHSTITLVVKKPKELCRGPLISSFFEEGLPLDGYWFGRSEFDYLVYTYQGYLARNSLTDTLSLLFQRLLEKQPFSDSLIEELRMDYKEDQEEPVPAPAQKLFETLWDGDFEYVDRLFTKDNNAISQAYHSLFEPSRMAVIVEGSFDGLNVEEIFEGTFGRIIGEKMFLSPLGFKPKKTLAFAIEAEGGVDFFGLDQDEEHVLERTDLVYLYCYPVAPTYREHVLNDLYFCTNFYEDSDIYNAIIGKLRPTIFFPSIKPITISSLDPFIFNMAKDELKERYQCDHFSAADKCLYHFLSDIPDKLELDNQHLLHELELVTFSDYCSFVEGQFQHIPVETVKIPSE